MRSVSIFFYIAINLKGLLHSICLTSKIRRLFNFFERHYLHWPWWWWPSWHQPCCLGSQNRGRALLSVAPKGPWGNSPIIRASLESRETKGISEALVAEAWFTGEGKSNLGKLWQVVLACRWKSCREVVGQHVILVEVPSEYASVRE